MLPEDCHLRGIRVGVIVHVIPPAFRTDDINPLDVHKPHFRSLQFPCKQALACLSVLHNHFLAQQGYQWVSLILLRLCGYAHSLPRVIDTIIPYNQYIQVTVCIHIPGYI